MLGQKINYKDVNPNEEKISKQILWNNSNIKQNVKKQSTKIGIVGA